MKKCMKMLIGCTAAAGLLSGCVWGAKAPVEKTALPQPGVAGSSPSAQVNAFFDQGPMAQDIKLSEAGVFPRGRQFPFSFYSTGGGSVAKRGELLPEAEKRADQLEILNAGVTLIGPQYELNGECVQLAREYKRHAIYTLVPELDGKPLIGSKAFDQFNDKNPMPATKIGASIAAQVRAVAADPEIAWWDITPEELRFWRKNEVAYLKLATDVIRANDPLKRPIMMYEPGHRNADALTKLTPYLDFIAKGMYTNYSGWGKNRVWVLYSTGEAVQARKQLKRPEITVLALPEMFVEPKDKAERALIPTWVRHDVYGSLIAGAQGVLVFSASKRPNFESRQAYLDAYLEICRELVGPAGLGQVFLFGKRMDDLEFQTVSGPEKLELTVAKKKVEMPAVALANFAYDHLRYVFVVNSSNEPVSGMVRGLVYGGDVMVRDMWSDAPAWHAPEGEFEVELPPLGVAAYVVYRQN